jgi:hypothetical protein
MGFNASINNILIISKFYCEEIKLDRVTGEHQRPVAGHRQTLSHNVVLSTSAHW